MGNTVKLPWGSGGGGEAGGGVDLKGGVSAALGVTLPSVVITRASGLLAAGSEPDVLETQEGGSGGTAISSEDRNSAMR